MIPIQYALRRRVMGTNAPIIVLITGNNIGEYFTVNTKLSNYTFTWNPSWSSKNKVFANTNSELANPYIDVDPEYDAYGSTSAYLQLTPLQNCHISFDYQCSSEEGWDTFSVRKGTKGQSYANASTKIVNEVSGEVGSNCSFSMTTNETMYWRYSKDESGYDGDDCAYISNFYITI